MRNAHRFAVVAAAMLLLLERGPAMQAQAEPETGTSFTQLAPLPGDPLAYAVPLHYGSFADVEIAAAGSGTVQLEVEVLEESAIQDRRIWVLLPGRVTLLTEVLGVDDLFEIGSPLLVRWEASDAVGAVLVRRD